MFWAIAEMSLINLIAWYTDSTLSDAQSAIHFSSRRPILGICLKRYSVLPNGNAVRLNTFVDIPIEIGLPHFIQDDEMENEGPLCGNFKLSLQAVICHRGNSVESGHYIALVRGTSLNDPDKSSKYCRHWMRFDDLAQERITLVDIEKALVEESPYLLFYQILPIGDDSETISRGRLSSSNEEETQTRKLFHNPYPDVTVSAQFPVNDSSDVEADGILHNHYPNHRFGSPGTSSGNSQIHFPAEANDESVGDRVKSTSSSQGTSTSANAVRSIGRERSDVVDDGHMTYASTRNDTIVVVEPTSDVDFEESNTRSSRVERRAKVKHAMLAKEKPDNPAKHRSHHSLKKGSGKPDRECLVM